MRLLTIAALLIATASMALAQQRPATRPAAKPAFPPPTFKITIATEGKFPPFNSLDRKGLPNGFEMELAQEACQRMKAECEFVAYKWDELIPGLLDEKFDVIMSSLEVTNERRKRLAFSRRYYQSPGAFAAHKGGNFDGPPTLLRNKRIGVQRESMHADWLDKSFRRSAQIKRFATVGEALRALQADEIDAVFGDKVELWMWTQKKDGECCEVTGQDIKDPQTLGIGVAAGLRKEDVKLRDALNKAFAEIIGDGTYKRFNDKYFPFPIN